MPLYGFKCEKCGEEVEVFMHLNEYVVPEHCGGKMNVDLRGHGGFTLQQTPGKWTGFYDYDYGKKATWDLTPPGKLEELRRRGVIAQDPFEKAA